MVRSVSLIKFLLNLEFYLAFTMPTLILIYGLVFLPFILIALPYQTFSSIYMLSVIFSGGCGIWAAYNLFRKTTNPDFTGMSEMKTWSGLALGLLANIALIVYVVPGTGEYTGSYIVSFLTVLPIFVVLHFLWLNKYRSVG